MLRINNRGFKRSYVYGGTGIFDSIAKTVSNVAQKAASVAGKKLGEKGVEKISSLISRSRDKPSELTSKSQEILRKYTSPLDSEREEFNLNNLIAGSAIRIEDYIKRT